MYFENPTQVIFEDPDNPGEWLKGIAYRDEVICACCGGAFEIDDIEQSKTGEKGIYTYFYWEDLSDAIYGGELPEGLGMTDDFKIVEVAIYDDEAEYVQETFSEWESDLSEEDEAAWIEYFDSHFPQ